MQTHSYYTIITVPVGDTIIKNIVKSAMVASAQ